MSAMVGDARGIRHRPDGMRWRHPSAQQIPGLFSSRRGYDRRWLRGDLIAGLRVDQGRLAGRRPGLFLITLALYVAGMRVRPPRHQPSSVRPAMDLARDLRPLIRRPVLRSPQSRARVLHGDPIDLLRLSLVQGVLVFLVPAFSSANTARHRIDIAIVACTLGLSAAAIYEIYEWVLVSVFGSNKFVSESAMVESAMVDDLFDGVVGAAVGGCLLARLARTDTGTRRAERSGEPEPPVAPGDAERRDDPGRADSGDDRVAVEGRAAEHAVEDDPRRGTDGDPDDERTRAHAREAARVVEGTRRQPGRAADERDAPGAAALQPVGDRAGPVRQPIGERRRCQPARDRERGEGAQRAADEAQRDARRPEQRDGEHVQHGSGEQQAGRRDPGGDEQQRRPDAGGRHEPEPRVRVAREQQDGGDGREEQRRHGGETP
jgi:hypothetical protein